MKKILGLCLVVGLGLGGCSQAYVNKMSEASVTVSDFDGTKTISSRIMPAYVKGGWGVKGVSFGAHGVSSAKEYVAFDVEFNNITTNLDKLYLNIDGVVSKHNTLGNLTKFGSNGTYRTSTNSFMVPYGTANKLLTSKDVKFRVTTLSDGAREGHLIQGDMVTPAANSLISVIKQAN